MAMVCPQCRTSQRQGDKCTSCGSRLLFQANLGAQTSATSRELNAWQQTPWGRIIVGLLLAQGLAHGLSMFWTAGHLASGEEPQVSFWATQSGFLLWQGIQGVGLLVGGALAGAGQARAVVYGSFLGLISGLFAVVIQQGRGDALEPMWSYAQPVFHLFCGAVGALIGVGIWRPLPVVRVPSAPEATQRPRKVIGRPAQAFAGPICWLRIALGVVVVVAGVLYARSILNFIVNISDGKLAIQSSSQAKILTLEIGAFAALLGAGFAGATTQSGLKQGFFVGLAASILAAGINLGRPQIVFDNIVLMTMGIFVTSLVGGWFGGMLFPPASGQPRRRGILHE